MSLFKNLFGKKEEDVIAFADGTIVPIEEVPDPVFSGKAMGEGFAIQPTAGKVYAPVSGTIEAIYPTGHAICLSDSQGREILIHVGIDTVNLKGQGFTVKARNGQNVKAGDLLVEFDQDLIKEKGLNDIVIFVLTNSGDFSTIEMLENGEVKAKTPVMHTAK